MSNLNICALQEKEVIGLTPKPFLDRSSRLEERVKPIVLNSKFSSETLAYCLNQVKADNKNDLRENIKNFTKSNKCLRDGLNKIADVADEENESSPTISLGEIIAEIMKLLKNFNEATLEFGEIWNKSINTTLELGLSYAETDKASKMQQAYGEIIGGSVSIIAGAGMVVSGGLENIYYGKQQFELADIDDNVGTKGEDVADNVEANVTNMGSQNEVVIEAQEGEDDQGVLIEGLEDDDEVYNSSSSDDEDVVVVEEEDEEDYSDFEIEDNFQPQEQQEITIEAREQQDDAIEGNFEVEKQEGRRRAKTDREKSRLKSVIKSKYKKWLKPIEKIMQVSSMAGQGVSGIVKGAFAIESAGKGAQAQTMNAIMNASNTNKSKNEAAYSNTNGAFGKIVDTMTAINGFIRANTPV